jgi:hypothetical protein
LYTSQRHHSGIPEYARVALKAFSSLFSGEDEVAPAMCAVAGSAVSTLQQVFLRHSTTGS